ncbi:MAG: sulfatase, partial [Mariniphaga sp.]
MSILTRWLLFFSGCFILLMPISEAEAQQSKPNVLLITIDDMNDWVGYLEGHSRVQTPNIDRLADRGLAFTNAHVQAPICNPSRTSFLTGLRPTTTGVYALGPWFRELPQFADHVTLPQYFESHGYKTLTTGKVYHDAYPPKESRKDGPEFSVWGFHGGFFPRPEKPLVENTGHPLIDWGVYPEEDMQQDDWKVSDWAIDQLRNLPKDEPFFLSVGFRHPHVPLYVSQKWFDLYPEDEKLLPEVLGNDRDDIPRFAWYLHWKLPEPRLAWLQMINQWKPKVRAYLASISFADMLVGRVLDALEAEGLAENTIVALLSDHGYHMGTKGITGKNTLWRESTRVAYI